MTPDAFEDLAHTALEGNATPEQRAALDAQLASDPEARRRWLELETAFQALGQVRPVAPPLDLKPAIMRAIHAERRATGAIGASGKGLGRLLGFRLASAFAAGAVAGVIVWSLATPNRGSLGNLPVEGTLMPQPAPRALDTGSFRAGSARANVEMSAVGEDVIVSIDARSMEPAELVLEYYPQLRAASVEGIEAQPWGATFTPGNVQITFGRTLRCSIVIRGENAASRQLQIRLRSGSTNTVGTLGAPAR